MATADRQAIQNELTNLRSVCGQVYELAGCIGAPERVLNVLGAAADGKPLPNGGHFLPVTKDACSVVQSLRDRLVKRIHEVYEDRGVIEPADLRRAALEVQAFDHLLGAYLQLFAATSASVKEVMARVAEFDREWQRG